MSTVDDLHITAVHATDFEEWARLFRKYIDYYESALPDDQYRNTLNRILDPGKDLYAFILRSSKSEQKLYGIVHFYPHQTPWSEQSIMHMNGKSPLSLLLTATGTGRSCFSFWFSTLR